MNPTKPSALFLLLSLLLASLPSARAEQFGLFTYEVNNGEITITDYPEDATGEVEIPAEIDGLPVTAIGWEAFHGCAGLTELTLPATVNAIYGFLAFAWEFSLDPFVGCTALTSFEVNPENRVFASHEGALLNSSRTTVFRCPEGIQGTYLIPDSVNSVDKRAFQGCTGLKAIEVSRGNTTFASHEGVLFNSNLTRIVKCPEGKQGSYMIPEGVTRIGSNGSASSHGEIPVSPFMSCEHLTSVIIPASVIDIRRWAFSGCSALTSLKVHSGNSLFTSHDGVILREKGREVLFCPEGKRGTYLVPEGVTTIGREAFSDCAHLTNIILPDGVTTIRERAFSGCNSLTGMILPEGVNFIGSEAFSDCAGLTRITIPASMVKFDHGNVEAFRTFDQCSALISIEVDSNNPEYASHEGVLFNKTTTKVIYCPRGKQGDYTIPEVVTSIGDDAFSGCIGLTSVIIPGSVTFIGNYAFYHCTGLTSVTISEGVETIGSGAFSGCIGLTFVTIPASVAIIGYQAFSACSDLTSIEVDALNPEFSSLNGVVFNKDRTRLIHYPEGKSGDYLIPDSVTSIASRWCFSFILGGGGICIGSGAFGDSSKLTGVGIPSGVTSIGAETFNGSPALPTITIPASVTSIGNEGNVYPSGDPLSGAFEDCTSLHSAIFLGDAPTKFDENTFANTAPDFTIYYLRSSTGFTSPTWNGYPTIMLDEVTDPAAPWLVSHGLPQDTDLHEDLNGDGVPLRMAYALGLDPRANLSRSLPVPTIHHDTLALTFPATAKGITYKVETSTDLKTWTTEGVTTVPLGGGNRRASIPLDQARPAFLRLVVSDSSGL